MSSFEALRGNWLRGQPVPNDLTTLMHDCTGSDCTFCAWRKENPINLGWERLLDDDDQEGIGATVCGVDLTCSQLENPDRELSTQQTAAFLTAVDDFPRSRLRVREHSVSVRLLSPIHVHCSAFLVSAAYHRQCYLYRYGYRYHYSYCYFLQLKA